MRVASGRCTSGAGISDGQVARSVAGKVQAILIRATRRRPHKTSQPPHQGHIRWSGTESLPPCRARRRTGNRKQAAPSLRDSGQLRNRFPALKRGANLCCASGPDIFSWRNGCECGFYQAAASGAGGLRIPALPGCHSCSRGSWPQASGSVRFAARRSRAQRQRFSVVPPGLRSFCCRGSQR
jgi:hypothetical protein